MTKGPLEDSAWLNAALARWTASESLHGLFVTDTEFRIVLWNRWMEAHSGHLSRETVGHSLFDLYPELGSSLMREYYESALAGQVTVVSHGLHRQLLPLLPATPDSTFERMPQSGHISPLTDGERVLGTVTGLEDVTDRLITERELRRQIEALQQARSTAEQALRAKDDFLSTLSHEIRTPLNAVLGWARILLAREEIDRELLTRALTVIERNASAQSRLIDDMLDMARIVAGKLRLELQPVDLASVILSAVDVVAPAALAKSLTLRTTLDPRSPQVLGDPDRLQQAIWNLLSNALKFTPSGGEVEVRMDIVGHTARVTVRDTGQGIGADFLPFVFDRFRQRDPSSTRRSGGLGLGLGLVRELVALHGGSVRAASPGEDEGATFTIDLPLGSLKLDAPQDVPRRESNASLEGVRVLLLEDDTDARDLAHLALEQSGAHVTSVSSSAAAFEVLRAASPGELAHVIVSDIAMADEDGYGFIRHVRALSPNRGGRIPALSVTGYASSDDVRRALAAGFQMHLAKPVDPNTLVDAVAALAAKGPIRERAEAWPDVKP